MLLVQVLLLLALNLLPLLLAFYKVQERALAYLVLRFRVLEIALWQSVCSKLMNWLPRVFIMVTWKPEDLLGGVGIPLTALGATLSYADAINAGLSPEEAGLRETFSLGGGLLSSILGGYSRCSRSWTNWYWNWRICRFCSLYIWF